MKTLSFTILLSLCCFVSYAQSIFGGPTFPHKLKQNKTELVLNGGGIRKVIFFKIYALGLYLPEKNKNGSEICKANKPMLLRLQIRTNKVTSKKMRESIQKGFEKSTGGNIAPLKERVATFINTFNKQKIKEGDLFDIWYNPDTGVQAFKNGKLQTSVEGVDFKKALFGIWLAESAESSMKKKLLGNY